MSRENHTSHMALWNDLTRRAPDEVRAAPASMLGFASWLHGDGAKAWCALDQVPADRPYSMAARSEEHTSELQSLMRISYAVFCLKRKNNKRRINSERRQVEY